MMFQGRVKVPQYTGDIIVCLDKARPFSEIENGREIIGILANTRIKTSNIRSKHSSEQRVYQENEIAVPVAIFNTGTKAIEDDWTRTFCPITERDYSPMQRWWPKSIFKGSQKIGDIAEEIVIEYPRYTIKLHVSYAFTAISKELFTDIDAEEKKIETEKEEEKENIRFNLVRGEGEEGDVADIKLVTEKVGSENKKPEGGISAEDYNKWVDAIVKKQKQRGKEKIVKFIVGGLLATALVTGLVFGIKYIVANKSSKE